MNRKDHFLKDGRFIYPLFATWIALTVWLFRNLLTSPSHEGNLTSNLLLGCCISFCYFWGIYHWSIVFQHVINRKQPKFALTCPRETDWPRVAILYCVCDNLDHDAVLTATRQNYPAYDVFILDDSRTAECRSDVDQMAKEHALSVIRRTSYSGHKGGNLNNALAKLDDRYPFAAINDADELLPPDFLRSCVSVLLPNQDIAFIQAHHSDRATHSDTNFTRRFGVMTDVRWAFYREYTNNAGTCFSLGHGVVLRTAAWRSVGGYPEVVSEDIAMTLRLLAKGWRGIYLHDVKCRERFADTYRRFRLRFSRCIEADVECSKVEMSEFLRSPMPLIVEKFDAVIRECRYPAKALFLPLTAMISVILAICGTPAFLSHPTWITLNACLLLGPWIPYFIALRPQRSFAFFASSVWAFSCLAIVMTISGIRALSVIPTFITTFDTKEHDHPALMWRDALCGIPILVSAYILSSSSLMLIGAALATSPWLAKDSWWRSNALSVYLPISVLAGGVFVSEGSSAVLSLLPLVLLLY